MVPVNLVLVLVASLAVDGATPLGHDPSQQVMDRPQPESADDVRQVLKESVTHSLRSFTQLILDTGSRRLRSSLLVRRPLVSVGWMDGWRSEKAHDVN